MKTHLFFEYWMLFILMWIILEQWYLNNHLVQPIWQPSFPLFSLVKNNGERKKKRESKNKMWIWERKLSQSGCTNIIAHHFIYRRFSYFCFWCRLFCEFWLMRIPIRYFFFLRDLGKLIIYNSKNDEVLRIKSLFIFTLLHFDVNHFSYRCFSYFCFWCGLFCEFWVMRFPMRCFFSTRSW